jgi:hypothetical protein
MSLISGREGEALGVSLADVENELGVLPYFVLAMVDVEGASADRTQEDVVVADDKFTLFEADRQTAIAASTGLEEHHRTPLADKARDGSEGVRSGDDTGSYV